MRKSRETHGLKEALAELQQALGVIDDKSALEFLAKGNGKVPSKLCGTQEVMKALAKKR